MNPPRSRRRRKSKFGDLVLDEPEEVDQVRQAIQEVLRQPLLSLQEEALPRGELAYVLNGPGAAIASDERHHPVVPFLTTEVWVYWIGLQLKFESVRTRAAFLSASLVVLEGPTASGKKEPLLRAEWERFREGQPGPHAQPHWHVYRSALETPSRLQAFSLEPEIERLSLEEGKMDEANRAHLPSPRAEALEGMPRFHMAMTARWHFASTSDEPLHYEPPDAEKLGQWVRRCIAYTRDQLVYVSGKLPAGAPLR